MTAVGPFVLAHVRMQRRAKGRSRLLEPGEPVPEVREHTRETVLDSSRYLQDPFHLSHPIEWCPWTIARLRDSAHLFLGFDTLGILRGRSATTVYPCTCGFVRTR